MADEGERDDILAGYDDLVRQYREGAIDTSPGDLDEVLLAESRRALGAQLRGPRLRLLSTPFSARHWGVPLSLAAVLVVSVSVVTIMPSTKQSELPKLRKLPEIRPNVTTPISAPSATVPGGQPMSAREPLPEADLRTGVIRTRAAPGGSEEAPRTEDSAPSRIAPAPIWLQEIDRMLEAGLPEKARVHFYAFRQHYPYHPIPEDLLERLGM